MNDEVMEPGLANERLHDSVRAAAAYLRTRDPRSDARRLEICRSALTGGALLGSAFSDVGKLQKTDQYYWISALYMLLMPPMRRRRLAAFFTPPHLCNHVLARLEFHGADFASHRVLDPASGGAAFLVPWAQRLLASCRASGLEAANIIQRAQTQLSGIEIEPGLAQLSEYLLADVFQGELTELTTPSLKVIRRGNALANAEDDNQYDVVVANPPYGRVFRPSASLRRRWAHILSHGHVNTYALFVGLALERLKPGGLAALVIPTSFIAGPYFTAFREHLLHNCEVLELNLVRKRSAVFLDVIQDTCVLILRKGTRTAVHLPACHIVQEDGSATIAGNIGLPNKGGRAWTLPSLGNGASDELFHPALKTLADYGYTVKAGYFVWNRSKERLNDRLHPEPGEVPLVWAHNIATGDVNLTARSDRSKISFVTLPDASTALVTEESVVLQRTTNKSQRRLLIAARVPSDLIARYGAFVSENHTIVVSPKRGERQQITPTELAALLNTKPLDDRYRRISGTVNISTRLLRELPLPDPNLVPAALASSDPDARIELAYWKTIEGARPDQLNGPAENPPEDSVQE
ncbi:N-6 DNA Methylase [compost metagenome]